MAVLQSSRFYWIGNRSARADLYRWSAKVLGLPDGIDRVRSDEWFLALCVEAHLFLNMPELNQRFSHWFNNSSSLNLSLSECTSGICMLILDIARLLQLY
jgi:hypothetical protein